MLIFFNNNFDFDDHYYSGFPTRRIYCADCIQRVINAGLFENFLDIIIDDDYFLKDLDVSPVEASEKTKEALDYINNLFIRFGFELILVEGHADLIEVDSDLNPIGSGGFADVYLRKSTGCVVKELKREFWSNEGVVSRFKREYEILTDLQDVTGVVQVYDFSSDYNRYSMEYAGETLECFLKHEFNFDVKKDIMIQILSIAAEVHSRNIVHRDLSPNNIFVKNKHVIVTDFGLGKNFDSEYSHHTVNTNNYGCIGYVAPEQIHDLKIANKQSEVFSLGRIINLIMTGDNLSLEHKYAFECDVATSLSPEERYADASEMLGAIMSQDVETDSDCYKERIKSKLKNNILDGEVEKYYLNLDEHVVCNGLIDYPLFFSATKYYVLHSTKISEKIVTSISSEWENRISTFDNCDNFFDVCANIVVGTGNASGKIRCSKFISYMAYKERRARAEYLVNELMKHKLKDELKTALMSYEHVG